MRALRSGRLGAPAARPGSSAARGSRAARPGDLRRSRRSSAAVDRARGRVGALHRQQRRAGEEQEGDHRRDRVAGQAEDERAARRDAEPGRLAGPQRDAPEDLLDAERRERRPDVVVLADRDAAADDERRRRRAPRSIASRVAPAVVADRRRREPTSAPGRARERRDRVGVGVADLRPAASVALGLDQLVAGEQDGDARAARARDGRRCRPTASTPSSAGPDPRARLEQDRRPAAMSSPARRMLRAGLDRGARPRRLAARGSVSSTRTTASAPAGTIAPVEIAIASPGSERGRGRVAGAGLVDDAAARRGACSARRRRCRRRGPRSRPSPSCRSPARRLGRRPPRRATRPSRRAQGDDLPVRPARTRSSTSRARGVDVDQRHRRIIADRCETGAMRATRAAILAGGRGTRMGAAEGGRRARRPAADRLSDRGRPRRRPRARRRRQVRLRAAGARLRGPDRARRARPPAGRDRRRARGARRAAGRHRLRPAAASRLADRWRSRHGRRRSSSRPTRARSRSSPAGTRSCCRSCAPRWPPRRRCGVSSPS